MFGEKYLFLRFLLFCGGTSGTLLLKWIWFHDLASRQEKAPGIYPRALRGLTPRKL